MELKLPRHECTTPCYLNCLLTCARTYLCLPFCVCLCLPRSLLLPATMPISAIYTWEQTRENVVLHVALKGTAQRHVDIYTSDCFVKINFAPYLLAVDLFSKVNDDKTVARFDQRDGMLHITLPKTVPGEWESLTFKAPDTITDKKVAKLFLMERRNESIERRRKYDEEEKEKVRERKRENERMTLRKQMAVEEGERQNIEELKEEEKTKAEKEVYDRFQEMEREKRETADKKERERKEAIRKKEAALVKASEPLTARVDAAGAGTAPPEPSSPSVAARTYSESEAFNAEESDIFGDDDLDDGKDKKVAGAVDSQDDLEEEDVVDDEIKYVPEPRNQHDDGVLTYSITHTERFFPTPLRESKQMDEENWLAKNASHVGRRLGEKRKPGDSRDISERDPFWLKGKGDDFFRAKDYKSAISAYSSAYEIDEGMTAALSNRAACHLLLSSFDFCIKDCNTILERVPLVTAAERNLMTAVQMKDDAKNMKLRMKILVRRGSAYCKLGKYPEAIQDYEDSIRLAGSHPALSKSLELDPLWDDLTMMRKLQSCSQLKTEADEHFRQGDVETAYDKYSKALAEEPGFVSILSNRASVLLAMGKWSDAIDDCSMALSLLGVHGAKDTAVQPVGPVPQKHTARFNAWAVKTLARRGTAYCKRKDYEKALADFEDGLKLDHENASLLKDVEKVRDMVARDGNASTTDAASPKDEAVVIEDSDSNNID